MTPTDDPDGRATPALTPAAAAALRTLLTLPPVDVRAVTDSIRRRPRRPGQAGPTLDLGNGQEPRA